MFVNKTKFIDKTKTKIFKPWKERELKFERARETCARIILN